MLPRHTRVLLQAAAKAKGAGGDSGDFTLGLARRTQVCGLRGDFAGLEAAVAAELAARRAARRDNGVAGYPVEAAVQRVVAADGDQMGWAGGMGVVRAFWAAGEAAPLGVYEELLRVCRRQEEWARCDALHALMTEVDGHAVGWQAFKSLFHADAARGRYAAMLRRLEEAEAAGVFADATATLYLLAALDSCFAAAAAAQSGVVAGGERVAAVGLAALLLRLVARATEAAAPLTAKEQRDAHRCLVLLARFVKRCGSGPSAVACAQGVRELGRKLGSQ